MMDRFLTFDLALAEDDDGVESDVICCPVVVVVDEVVDSDECDVVESPPLLPPPNFNANATAIAAITIMTTTIRMNVILQFFHHILRFTFFDWALNWMAFKKERKEERLKTINWVHKKEWMEKKKNLNYSRFELGGFVDEIFEAIAALQNLVDVLRHDALHIFHLTLKLREIAIVVVVVVGHCVVVSVWCNSIFLIIIFKS